PPLAGHHHARVHVHGGDMRVPGMGDEGDAGGPEARAFFSAVHLGGEFGRELPEDGGDVDADLLEDAAAHDRHLAAAAIGPGVVPALPWVALEAAGLAIGQRAGDRVLEGLEAGAEPVAELPEPGGGSVLPRIKIGGVAHARASNPDVWRIASPSTRLAAMATLSERMAGRMGMRTRRSAVAATVSGTPALSRPTMRMSPSP